MFARAILVPLCCLGVPARGSPIAAPPQVEHVVVASQPGKFMGWPANWGIWAWENEILVGFTAADHREHPTSHPYASETGRAKFARSRDGGVTWTIEDALANGITAATFEHNIGAAAVAPRPNLTAIRFDRPDMALTFRMHTLRDGPTSWYVSDNRGRQWQGPFTMDVSFPDRDAVQGIVSRTSYVVDGKGEVTAFLTVGFRRGAADWREVVCVRTADGGRSWRMVSWLGDRNVNAIMPSAVRLRDGRLLVGSRLTAPPELACFSSDDNGLTWTRLPNPAPVDRNGSPPAMVAMRDGRVGLVYGLRGPHTSESGRGIYARFSADNGRSWTREMQIRGGDGANWDIGYPVAIQRADGRIVAVYYYNHAADPARSPYRYLAATIFDPPAAGKSGRE